LWLAFSSCFSMMPQKSLLFSLPFPSLFSSNVSGSLQPNRGG
jgi:hypothetical protein